jgi:hypothetical protein
MVVANVSGYGTQFRGLNFQILEENQTLNLFKPNIQNTSPRIPNSSFESLDFDGSDSFFFNDDSRSRPSFFVDSGNDERREPEFDIGDFDGDGSEF